MAFTFGVGESASHLVLELYAGGNVIMTDHKRVAYCTVLYCRMISVYMCVYYLYLCLCV